MCLLFVHVLAGADRGLGCMSLGTHILSAHTHTQTWARWPGNANSNSLCKFLHHEPSVTVYERERRLTRWCPVLCPSQGGPLRGAEINPHYINQAHIQYTHMHNVANLITKHVFCCTFTFPAITGAVSHILHMARDAAHFSLTPFLTGAMHTEHRPNVFNYSRLM